MLDLVAERARVLEAGDAERAQLADHIAVRAEMGDLIKVAAWLTDEDEGIRRAAIRVLEQAKFKPAIGALCAVARARGGAERLAALTALCMIADQSDRAKIEPLLSLPVADVDERAALDRLAVVVDHAQPEIVATEFGLLSSNQAQRREALVRVLQNADDPAETLAGALLESHSDPVRMDLLGGLGTLGPDAMLKATRHVVASADDDLLALLARKLVTKLEGAAPEVRVEVAALLRKAEARVSSLVTKGALDSAALALDPARAVSGLVARAAELDEDGLAALASAFAALSIEERVAAAEPLVGALASQPGRVSLFADALVEVVPRLLVAHRARLSGVVHRAASGEGDGDTSRDQGALARLCSVVLVAGTPLPGALAMGLSLSPRAEDRAALVQLCAALATEACAIELVKLTEDPEVAELAHEALRSFSSTEARVLMHPDRIEVLPAYEDRNGAVLLSEGRKLKDRDGREWVLSSGGPQLSSETPWGGCVCCFRPRALDDASGRTGLPLCPSTGERHLIDDGGPLLESSHALGGCSRCDSVRPLQREGDRIFCGACRVRYRREGDKLVAMKPVKVAVEPGRDNALPELSDALEPPDEAHLEKLPISVQAAMRATVILYGKGSFRVWGSTGICIFNDGDELGILTTRHGVEETAGPHAGVQIPLMCKTIAGEVAPARLIWTGRRGLDLALLAVKVPRPEEVIPLELHEDAEPDLGDPLFAVAHEISCPWSFYRGSVSALRSMRTSFGLEVNYVQTPMVLPAGTGGGGLFHVDGRLAGIISWFRRGGTTETNFAISVEAVRLALKRDRVKFGGARLV